MKLKQWFSVLLSAAMIINTFPLNAFAVGEVQQNSPVTEEVPIQESSEDGKEDGEGIVPIDEETISVTSLNEIPETDLPNNDEIFAAYVEREFYGNGISMFGLSAGARLTGDNKLAYDALVPLLKDIASGSETSTVLAVGKQTVGTSTTIIVDGAPFTYVAAGSAEFTGSVSGLDYSAIVNALMVDYPYEMYWFDKTAGYSIIPIDAYGEVILSFRVADAYAASADFTTDASKTAATTAAANNAKNIAMSHSSKSDYEKLIAFRDEICNAVAYNTAAAGGSYPYGDPWQLIYVFDNNSATDVVCEGYAKAFQYLCDLSGITCYTVSGTMTGGTGAGGHMWNIVNLDGENYLVDVTNSDSGTIGQSGGLFLVGNASGSVASGYTFSLGGGDIYFAYKSSTVDTWGTENLTLASSDYVPSLAKDIGTVTLSATVFDYSGSAITPNVIVKDTDDNTLTLGTDYTVSYANNINVGTATVTVEGIGDYQGSKTVNFTINKAASVLNTAPTAKAALVYDGSAQALVNAGSANGGTVQYSLDGSTYSNALPSAVNAGSYTVYYKVAGDANHNDTAASTITCSIAKATPSTSISPLNATYGQTLGDIKSQLPDGWTWVLADSTSVGGFGTNTVYVNIAETANYIAVSNVAVQVNVAKAAPSMVAPTAKTGLIYNNSAQALVNEGTVNGGTMLYSLDGSSYSSTIPSASDAGTYTVYYKVTGDANHSDIDAAQLTVSIGKANPTVIAPSIKTGLVYNSTSQSLVTAGTASVGTVLYSVNGGAYTSTLPAAKNAGSYSISYKVEVVDSNYNSIEEMNVGNAVIAAKNVSTEMNAITFTPDAVTYNGMLHNVTINIPASLGSDFSYDTEGTLSAADAGTYNVTITAKGNYSGTVTKSWKIKEAVPSWTGATAKSGLVYNGSPLELINAGTATNGTMEYSLDGVSYSTEIPNAVDAGNYTVYYRVIGDVNYSDVAPMTIVVSVAKKDVAWDLTVPTDLVYNGDNQDLLRWTYYDAESPLKVKVNGVEANPLAKDAGTYTVTYWADASTNYNAISSTTVTVTIAKASVTVTADNVQMEQNAAMPGLTYQVSGLVGSDTESVLGITLSTSADGTVLGNFPIVVSASNPNYVLTLNNAVLTVSDHIHVWNYSASGTVITATCNKNSCTETATVTLSAPSNLTYDGTQKDVVVTQVPDSMPLAAKTISYNSVDRTNVSNETIVATLEMGGETVSVSYTLTPKAVTPLVTLGTNPTYNGTELTVPVTVSGGSFTYTVSGDTAINAGTYTVTVTANGNYSGTASKNWEVLKATPSYTVPSPLSATYGQTLADIKAQLPAAWEWKSAETSPVGAVGENVFWAKIPGDANHNDVNDIPVTVSVSKASPIVSAPSLKSGLNYTGSSQELVNAGSAIGGTIMYKVNSGAYSSTVPSSTNAGTYTIYYKVVGDVNYQDIDEQLLGSVSIAKAAPLVNAPSAVAGLTYTGSAQTLITAGTTSGGTMEYSLDGNTYFASLPSAVDAGNYTVYYRVIGNINYSSIDGQAIAVTIAKAAPAWVAPTAKSGLIYTGTAQELINAGSAVGGEMQYKLNEGTYSTALPSMVNAGTYTVYYKVVGDANHSDSAESSVSITMEKAVPVYTAPTLAASYGQTLADVALPNGWQWEDAESTSVGSIGLNTFNARIMETENYHAVNGISVVIDVSVKTLGDADVDVQLSSVNYTYNGSEQKPSVSILLDSAVLVEGVDYDVMYNTDCINAGAKNVVINFKGNYSGSVIEGYTVDKAKLSPVLSGAASKVYDGKVNVLAGHSLTVTLNGIIGSDEVIVSAAKYEYTDKNAGNNKEIVASGLALAGAAKNNYQLTTNNTSAPVGTIEKATLDLTAISWSGASFDYDGEKHGPSINGIIPSVMKVELSGNVAVEIGEYTAKAVFSLKDGELSSNYQIVGSTEMTLTWVIKGSVTPAEGSNFKVVINPAITSYIPSNPKLNTPSKVEEAILNVLIEKNPTVPVTNRATYELILKYRSNASAPWQTATEDNWPSSGKLTVTLPYPEGTDSSYDFNVVHMFTKNMNGHLAGEFEYPVVSNTIHGIQFQVTGLSPIALSWTKSATGGHPDDADDRDDDRAEEYRISIKKSENGKVTSNLDEASKGEKVTLKVVADNGYRLEELLVIDRKGKEVKLTRVSEDRYSFRMPSSKVTVKASFEEVGNEKVNPNTGAASMPMYELTLAMGAVILLFKKMK